jgi:hypothetical protein
VLHAYNSDNQLFIAISKAMKMCEKLITSLIYLVSMDCTSLWITSSAGLGIRVRAVNETGKVFASYAFPMVVRRYGQLERSEEG